MRTPMKTTLAIFGASAALFAAGCGSDDETADNNTGAASTEMSAPATTEREGVEVGGEMMLPDRNVVENASNAPNLSTLVEAVTAADLVETLSGEGPFTVFAPDNDAFGKVDEAALASLLEPENKDDLTNVLTYHVVPGTFAAADLEDGQELTTVQGETLTVSIEGDTVKVGDATVTQADVFQSNGVAHVIDTVLMP